MKDFFIRPYPDDPSTNTVHSLTCVSVVVCVARKLSPCPSYSRRGDRINLGFCVARTREGCITPYY